MKGFKFNLLLIISLFVFQGCGSSMTSAKFTKTKQLVDNRKFEIQHE